MHFGVEIIGHGKAVFRGFFGNLVGIAILVKCHHIGVNSPVVLLLQSAFIQWFLMLQGQSDEAAAGFLVIDEGIHRQLVAVGFHSLAHRGDPLFQLLGHRFLNGVFFITRLHHGIGPGLLRVGDLGGLHFVEAGILSIESLEHLGRGVVEIEADGGKGRADQSGCDHRRNQQPPPQLSAGTGGFILFGLFQSGLLHAANGEEQLFRFHTMYPSCIRWAFSLFRVRLRLFSTASGFMP